MNLVLVRKILVFEIESWLWNYLLMLLLWDDSKHGLPVTPKPKNRLQFWATFKYMCSPFANTLEYWVKYFLHHHQKILKHFLLKAYAVIWLAIPHPTFYAGNPVSFYLTITMDKTRRRPVFFPFFVQLLEFFSYARGVLVTKCFYYCYWYTLARQQTITYKKHLW